MEKESTVRVQYKAPLKGELTVPGDKSISHRSIMLGSLAEGTTEISHFLNGEDCLATIDCFRRMGICIEQDKECIRVHGRGLHGLHAPDAPLDACNSGTTMRLLSGILAGQDFTSLLTGDSSLLQRPMKRIMDPLSSMGASVSSVYDNGCAPLSIHGKALHGTDYVSPVSSAQVKSCILLAGLYADGKTSVTEQALSRDHSERMLRYFGADVRSESSEKGFTAAILPDQKLEAQKIEIPGDFSSAAFFIAAALLTPHSELLLKNVCINPTRCGMLGICQQMGADLTVLNERMIGGEPCADLLVRSSRLKAVAIEGDCIPSLIDELPVLAVLAAFAEGTTVIRDAAELRLKESDRIEVMTENLARIGCRVTACEDGMIIEGGCPLHGAVIDPHKDHRVAMSFAAASFACAGEMTILDAGCTAISYPGFFEDLVSLCR